jgi:pyruvate formate lyase activating enzyme
LKKVELLPYHRLGVHRYRELGQEYPLHGVKTPGRDYMEGKAKVIRSEAPQLEVALR